MSPDDLARLVEVSGRAAAEAASAEGTSPPQQVEAMAALEERERRERMERNADILRRWRDEQPGLRALGEREDKVASPRRSRRLLLRSDTERNQGEDA